eukprot:CAMPEP_0194083202 /NCGR_PEP_ID=MMETSP0149-20130528/8504_1 /TAXON_ID=122233 /ORGANISM="Chaetoceros debilis, Strain MM31A-1" /LENGTH=75 /DNA_ID=CAMNT_0038765547 /DNA_START=597 /DNA_END=824 /DNA_ORIENTATION=-
MKYASPQLQAGHTAAVLSTFSHAAAPPNISSTSFRSGRVVLVKLFRMSHENGHVEQTNMELEDDDDDSLLDGVCI